MLFFTESIFEILARNTNSYARLKQVDKRTGRAQFWKDTSAAELKIFFGIIIYMGLFKSASVQDYWRKDGRVPIHTITRYMGKSRFENLKRWFHVSAPTITTYSSSPASRIQWFCNKLDPLTGMLQGAWQKYCTIATEFSVDE